MKFFKSEFKKGYYNFSFFRECRQSRLGHLNNQLSRKIQNTIDSLLLRLIIFHGDLSLKFICRILQNRIFSHLFLPCDRGILVTYFRHNYTSLFAIFFRVSNFFSTIKNKNVSQVFFTNDPGEFFVIFANCFD